MSMKVKIKISENNKVQWRGLKTVFKLKIWVTHDLNIDMFHLLWLPYKFSALCSMLSVRTTTKPITEGGLVLYTHTAAWPSATIAYDKHITTLAACCYCDINGSIQWVLNLLQSTIITEWTADLISMQQKNNEWFHVSQHHCSQRGTVQGEIKRKCSFRTRPCYLLNVGK